MNARRKARGAIRAITHQNATTEMALRYRDIIITAVTAVCNGVVDSQQKECWERLKSHAVPLLQCMGKGTDGLQMMRKEFEAEDEGVTIPTQFQWIANPRTIREARQYRGITVSSVVLS
jgi:hypothetical protein